MKLFHGTSSKILDKIRDKGILRSDHGHHWGQAISVVDSLEKAKSVAGYFGVDGIVFEVEVPDRWVEFHPDYGHGPEFDTIYIKQDVPPNLITNMHQTPNSDRKNVRPVGTPLRKWKAGLIDKNIVDEGLTAPQRRLISGKCI